MTGCNSLLIENCKRGYRKSYGAIRNRGRVSRKALWLCPLFCQMKFQLYLTGTLADFTLLAIDAPALWRIDFLYGVGGIFGFFSPKSQFLRFIIIFKKNKKITHSQNWNSVEHKSSRQCHYRCRT